MRFDMRCPRDEPGASQALYETALEMARWGEEKGCIQLVVSEHHGSPDGYLPSPLILAAAMAGRTQTTPIQVAALVLPLHDPISMAEQMAVLDITSQGRVSYVLAVGYLESEFDQYGQDFKARGQRIETCIEVLHQAWSGESFEFEGRPVRVTPRPLSPGGPALFMGGRSPRVARRAGRLGLGMIAQGLQDGLDEIYYAACEEAGQTPGLFVNPSPGAITAGFISHDPDRAWAEIGPHLLHDARAYGQWLGEKNARRTGQWASSVQELREANGIYRILTPEQAIEHIRTAGFWVTHPLCGGLPPDLAWPSLELLVNEVLPHCQGETAGAPPEN
ncbi:MAG: LLM class flavin-dependent oxidoreductase [Myxococcota bacterium]|nr:LLM class flavin-dependent oxidoreductase [Myxococcota bacterium]